MQGHLPPAAQDKYQEMQELQDEAEDVVGQKERAEDALEDTEAALDALEDTDSDATLYRSVATVRIETDPEETRSDLEAEKERLEDRIEELEAEKERIEEQFENRKKDIKHLLGGATGPGTDIN